MLYLVRYCDIPYLALEPHFLEEFLDQLFKISIATLKCIQYGFIFVLQCQIFNIIIYIDMVH